MKDKNVIRIEAILNKIEPLLQSHHKGSDIEEIRRQLNIASADNVSVLVCGEFKRGKSSFINAFLNEDVCPTDAGIATSVVSIIRYGEKKKVVRYYGDTNNLESEEISFDDIEKYAKGSSLEIDNTIMLSIEMPSDQLKNGLVLMDSPGVGGLDPRHLFVTLYVLPKANITFFVIDAGEPLSTTELDFYKTKILAHSTNSKIILNKCDLKTKEEISELIDDTKEKVANYCGVAKEEIDVIPVSSTHWSMYNRTKSEKMKLSSNCEMVNRITNEAAPQFRLAILSDVKAILLKSLNSMKEMEQYQLNQLTNPDESEQEAFKERLVELKEIKDNITNPNSKQRKNISKILRDSQHKVINELTKQSVLFSTEVLNALVERPEARSDNGGDWVLKQINLGLETLAGDVDLRIEAGFNDVMAVLGEQIELNESSFHNQINIDLTSSRGIADKTCTLVRSALPATGIALGGAVILGLVAAPLVAAIGGIAGAVAYVFKTNRDTNKNNRIYEIKNQLGPQITIAMNDLKAYVQQRYEDFNDALVENIERMMSEVVSDMQDVIQVLQDIENDKKELTKQKETIENTIAFIDTHIKQVQLLLTNPFAKQ